MRKLIVGLAVLVLFSAVFIAPAVTQAAGVSCYAVETELAQGESTAIVCDGFTPLTHVNSYVVEPDGTAVTNGTYKSDINGQVILGWQNGVKNQFSLLLGTYTIVVQEIGLAETVLRAGTVQITHVGDGDNVSGAYLEADKTLYDRSSEFIALTGWGFAPGEMVTLWIQKPALCSSYTSHYVDGKNGATFENIPNFAPEGTYAVDNIKANSAGSFSTARFFGADACEGVWRYAARGNTSGLGAWTEITLSGPSVSTNAWLVPSKPRVYAFNDSISFWASGFGANETLNCWTTSPDGRAVAYGINGSLSAIKMGADGSGNISLHTGSHIVSRDDPFYFGNTVDAVMSEGSLGVWHLTCTGLASGTTAIADYTVDGYTLDP